MDKVSEKAGLRCEHRHEPELRALAIRAWTLLETSAEADIKGFPLHPGWHSEWATWQDRYQAYLDAEASRR
jgi:hypothetical protein